MMNDARSRYVIDKKAIIRSADVSADYTIRPEPRNFQAAAETNYSIRQSADCQQARCVCNHRNG